MAPTHVNILINQLPAYFDSTLTIEQIDAVCNAPEEEIDDEISSDDEDDEQPNNRKDFRDINMIQNATTDSNLMELLQDLCREAGVTRCRTGTFDKYDNWQYLSTKIPVDDYLTFIYGLVTLAEYDPTETVHRRLAVAAVRTYITLLATPGQKQTTAYNETVMLKCLDIFKMGHTLSNPMYAEYLQDEREFSNKLLVEYVNIMNDIIMLLRFMTLKNCNLVKIALVDSMKTLLMHIITDLKNNTTAKNLAEKIFETLETICLPEHDEHNESKTTIHLILNRTAIFYKLEYKHTPQSFQIYNFFLKLLKLYPKDAPVILTTFIKSIITNPPKVFSKTEEYNYLMDIAVKYETEMFKTCNVSILDFLAEIEGAVDITTRMNTVEMLGRLAVINCKVEWEIFQSTVSDIPREVEMMRLLYNKLLDVNQSVKTKAFQVLLRVFQNGNKIFKQIIESAFHQAINDQEEQEYLESNGLEETFLNAERELGLKRGLMDFHSDTTSVAVVKPSIVLPSPPKKFMPEIKGVKTIEEILKSLVDVIYNALSSTSSNLKRIGLSVLEQIIRMNRNIMDEEAFKSVISKLAKDPVLLMRKTTLNVLNGVLKTYPSYRPIIKLWSKCLMIFLNDQDTKMREVAMDSLKVNVFDNIVRFEDSSSDKIFTPWMIIRSILILGKINVLKNAVDSWIEKSVLTPKNLGIIESHIFTVNCSEAWIMLSVIASKMKSQNPDVVIKTLNEIIQVDIYDSSICLQYIFDVIRPWLGDFTLSGLDHLFKLLCDLLRTGSTTISLVPDVYSLCCDIKERSDNTLDENWIISIRDDLAVHLLHYHTHYSSFNSSNERYLNCLIAYSETCTDLKERPNENIITLLLNYLSEASNDEKLILGNDQHRKLCVTITVLSRMAIRDGSLASKIIPFYNRILKFKNIQESILVHLIVAFSDLCKRHTSLVDTSMKTVISQLNSHYTSVRYAALSNLNELIIQDYIKMRGRVFLNILTLILDEEHTISAQALYVIQNYAVTRNEKLLKTSVLECVYVFNNFLQFADSEMFPASEFDNQVSPMSGSDAKMLKKRCDIYDFFVDCIDDISLLILLGNLNKLHDQLQKKKIVSCKEGAATIKDLIYIFTKICHTKDRDKTALAKAPVTAEDDDDEDAGPSTSKKAKKMDVAVMAMRSERGKKHNPTIQDAMVVVEKMVAVYHSFQTEVTEYISFDATLADDFKSILHEYALAIAKNFTHIVEYAKPIEFWSKLLKELDRIEGKDRIATKKVKRKRDESDDESEEDFENSEDDHKN